MNRAGNRTRFELSNLRIAVFSDAIAERNGVGTYYRDLVEHLKHRLGAAELFSPGGRGPNPLCGRSLPLPGDPTQRLFFPRPGAAARRLGTVSPHIVVCATPGPFGILGAAMGSARRSRLCGGYHTRYDQLVDLYWTPVVARTCSRVLRCWDRLFFSIAPTVVANSSEMAETAREMGVRRVHLVGTPIARHLLQGPTAPLSETIQTVLFAGRLAAEKNIAAVIRAAETLRSVGFVVAGDGPMAGEVRQAAGRLPNFHALGWVPRKALAAVMDRCDMLVLPSREEAFGTVALEAMARGRIVLVSSRCGILKWPKLAPGLFRIRPGESLADALIRIDRLEPAERSRRAALGREAAEEFNNDAVDDWLRVFARLAPGRLPSRKP